jgi:hypothetical protein
MAKHAEHAEFGLNGNKLRQFGAQEAKGLSVDV